MNPKERGPKKNVNRKSHSAREHLDKSDRFEANESDRRITHEKLTTRLTNVGAFVISPLLALARKIVLRLHVRKMKHQEP